MHHPCIDLPNKHSFAMETVHSATHALTMDKPSIFKNIGKKIKKKTKHAQPCNGHALAIHSHALSMHWPCISHAFLVVALGSGQVVKKWSLLTFLITV